MQSEIQADTLHLISTIDAKLIELLHSLTMEEWEKQTVAKLWKVKDVAAHLLDGNLRGLSIARDQYFGEKPENINSYQDLVDYLNQLNLNWTIAAKRLSPQVLISLLETTGKEYLEHLKTLNPLKPAIFSVAWAGQATSLNWFHIAREYTEKFLHQQQIRDAVGKPGIMTKELYYPFLDTLMYALPHTFKLVEAPNDTVVSLTVTTDIGGTWQILKIPEGWILENQVNQRAAAQVIIDPDTAWKLFSKSYRPEEVIHQVKIIGDAALGKLVLNMVAVMA